MAKHFTSAARAGFSLIELLIAFTLIIIIAGFAAFPLISYKKTEEFNTQEKIIIAVLRDAQGRAITREENYRWGVRFKNTTTTDTFQLFFGNNPVGQTMCGTLQTVTLVETKAMKDSSDFDPESLQEGCTKDIVFNPGSGTPNNAPGFESEITIIPKGFTTPPKTILINDNGSITF